MIGLDRLIETPGIIAAGQFDEKGNIILKSRGLNEFLGMKAEITETTDNPDIATMVDAAFDFINNDDPYYNNISYNLQKPQVKYWSVDYYGKKSDSYFLYWLPPGWATQPMKKALIYCQGHIAALPRRLAKLQLYARNYSMAVIYPQIWIETEERTDITKEWVQSGINRNDNTIFYVIGDYSRIFVFNKATLKILSEKYEIQENNMKTSKGFLLSGSEAFRYAEEIIDSNELKNIHNILDNWM